MNSDTKASRYIISQAYWILPVIIQSEIIRLRSHKLFKFLYDAIFFGPYFYHRQGVQEKWIGGKIEVKYVYCKLMVSLLWSEKLTAIRVTHCFLFDPGAIPPIFYHPDFHREAPIRLLVILSDLKNQMENDLLWPLGLRFYDVSQ